MHVCIYIPFACDFFKGLFFAVCARRCTVHSTVALYAPLGPFERDLPCVPCDLSLSRAHSGRCVGSALPHTCTPCRSTAIEPPCGSRASVFVAHHAAPRLGPHMHESPHVCAWGCLGDALPRSCCMRGARLALTAHLLRAFGAACGQRGPPTAIVRRMCGADRQVQSNNSSSGALPCDVQTRPTPVKLQWFTVQRAASSYQESANCCAVHVAAAALDTGLRCIAGLRFRSCVSRQCIGMRRAMSVKHRLNRVTLASFSFQVPRCKVQKRGT